MSKSIIKIALAFAVYFFLSSAFASSRGGHSGGGRSSGRSSSASSAGGRVYQPTAPRFNGSGWQRYSRMPHGSFPKAGTTGNSLRSHSARPPLNPPDQQKERLGHWSHNNRAGKSRLDPQTSARLRNWQGKRDNSAQANQEHHEHRHHHHDRNWWRHHCVAIVWFDWGFWGWEDGWWFPAWGYDPDYSSYQYDGPIYSYDGLPPDQIVANVQGALQRLGYYSFAVDGVLGPATQAAIERYQQDRGLAVTGGIDSQTLAALGFMR